MAYIMLNTVSAVLAANCISSCIAVVFD